VLVDFWATWCGPCKLVLPSVEWIEQEYGDHLKVVKVEADPNRKLMEKYKVLLRHLHRSACRSPVHVMSGVPSTSGNHADRRWREPRAQPVLR